jgi:UDP-glucose 4-epimerase
MTTILLTGGTGYIGSHTAVELIAAGYEVVIADDLSNSSKNVVDRIAQISGKKPSFYEIDVADKDDLRKVFSSHHIDAVIHFAGFKSVSESVREPLKYYRNNLDATLSLLEVMKAYGCEKIIFSSSATVYGVSVDSHKFNEEDETGNCSNPYGRTKSMIEDILSDVSKADEGFTSILLRYFNPVGAHESGLIGEEPNGIPNNLMPFITQVAAGILPKLKVFGSDYDTPDGTCIRDYIHVVDLARGHVAALEYAFVHTGCGIFNLGTGKGTSVLEMIHAFEEANGLRIPYEIAERRAGDVPFCVADPSKANDILGWKADKDIVDMCRDSWRWQQNCRNESIK